ncbi:MAG: TetR/AcrR family transcriptional regulator [Lachnospiraceae bacterium]|jgi:AcrR family transcriptional regulator|nr:TetR/AcrR family transcriptional regulator [Lachnospiraceae bacterium]
MGKAYTSDERADIKVRIMEAALDLYHENGAKTLNIRELAKRTGISPGGFYNFWPDKDSLILDIMKYRTSQKLDMMRPLIKDSYDDPIGFLSSQISSWFTDMKYKLDTRPIYREGMTFLQNTSNDKSNRFLALYSGYLEDIRDHWIKADTIESMDITGVTNVIISVSILLSNSPKLDAAYFEDLINSYISAGLHLYIKVKEH